MTKPTVVLLAVGAVIAAFLALHNTPLTDAPNHLARFYIVEALPESEPLREYYYLKEGFQPYLGIRVFFTLFSPLLGVEATGRLFAGVTAVLLPLGTVALSKAIHGRVTWVSLLSFLFVLNAAIGWGFLTFVFGLGLVPFGFAGWIASKERDSRVRLVATAVVILIVGCVHLIAGGFLFGLIAAYELAQATTRDLRTEWRPAARRLAAVLLLGVPVLVLVLVSPRTELGTDVTGYGAFLVTRMQLVAAPFTLFIEYVWEFVFGAASLALLYFALRDRVLGIPKPFGRLLILLAGAAAVSPAFLSGLAVLHIRLPILIWFVLLAAVDLAPRRRPTGAVLLAGTFAAIAAVVHFAWNIQTLRARDERLAELRGAAHMVTRGSKVLPAIDRAALEAGGVTERSIEQAASYLVIDRQVYLPTLFGMYEVGVREKYAHLNPYQALPVGYEAVRAALGGAAGALPRWAAPGEYDYIVVFGQSSASPLPARTELVHTGSYFNILKVVRTP